MDCVEARQGTAEEIRKLQRSDEKAEAERQGQEQAEEDKRQSVLAELIVDFQKLQEALIARGAKTFAELYPNIKTGENDNRYAYRSSSFSSKVKTVQV